MPTSRRPQKRCSSSPGLARPHPLVAPGDPPRRRPARPAAHPACPHHRLVMLATRPPSQCTTFASEATNATVMLGSLWRAPAGDRDHDGAWVLACPHPRCPDAEPAPLLRGGIPPNAPRLYPADRSVNFWLSSRPSAPARKDLEAMRRAYLLAIPFLLLLE